MAQTSSIRGFGVGLFVAAALGAAASNANGQGATG